MGFQKVIVFFTVAAVVLVGVVGFPEKRESENSSTPTNEKESSTSFCKGTTPCGWAIYDTTTRYITYFMKNTCICSSPTKCIRGADDISVSAYVYTCKDDTEEKS